MDHVVLAMAYAHMDQPESARSELESGRELIRNRLPNGTERIENLGSVKEGVWHDWVIAHLLMQEAEHLITPPHPEY